MLDQVTSLLICNSYGQEFYSKTLDGGQPIREPLILSGFIGAIGAIGRELFGADLATIRFDTESSTAPKIVIVTKNFYRTDARLHFVFLAQGEIDLKEIRKFCTEVYIKAKDYLREPSNLIGGGWKEIDRAVESSLNLGK